MSSENPQSIFQLTPSRRATVTWVPILCSQIFQLTPSRRATPSIPYNSIRNTISTHALTEGDVRFQFELDPYDISTHALTEGDFPATVCDIILLIFQLTPSRRATSMPPILPGLLQHFNSRPHGGRHNPMFVPTLHALFQLTPSRRAT